MKQKLPVYGGILILTVLFFYSCVQDEGNFETVEKVPVENAVVKERVQRINFDDLDQSLRKSINSTGQTKKAGGASGFKVDKGSAGHKVLGDHNRVSYTFPVSGFSPNGKGKVRSEFYFDNLVFVQDSLGGVKMSIFRYIPGRDWLEGTRDFKTYTGVIKYYNAGGTLVSSLRWLDGSVVDTYGSKDKHYSTKANDVPECMLVYDGFICTGGPYGYACSYEYHMECQSSGGSGPDDDDNDNDWGGDPPDNGGSGTPNDEGNPHGSNGNSGSNDDDDDIETVPVFVEGEIQDCINSGVPGDETTLDIDSFIESGLGYAELQVLNDFLKANQCSESAQWCVINAIISGTVIDLEDCGENSTEDDKIDASKLTGKAECLNDKLTKNGNTFVKDILSKFQGVSEFDINISSKDKIYSDNRKSFVNGQTSYKDGDKIIYITISEDKISNKSVLSGIRTILHEYIHADIFRKLNTKYNTQDGIKDFKKTYETYEREKHHNSMASLYINSMTKSLKEIHKNILSREYNYLSNNGSKSLDDMYEALAWQGLKNHKLDAWKELGQDTTRINTALTTYHHSLTKNCPK